MIPNELSALIPIYRTRLQTAVDAVSAELATRVGPHEDNRRNVTWRGATLFPVRTDLVEDQGPYAQVQDSIRLDITVKATKEGQQADLVALLALEEAARDAMLDHSFAEKPCSVRVVYLDAVRDTPEGSIRSIQRYHMIRYQTTGAI